MLPMPKERQARWQKAGATSGRSHLATADKIFDRIALLPPIHSGERLPIYLTDNIPKDLFFPLEETDISATLASLPADDCKGITHIWLRRPLSSEFRSGRIPLAEYIALGEAALIVIYPWPTALRMPLTKKPADKVLNRYRRFAPKLTSHKGKWHLEWLPEQAKDFCANELIRHEVATHAEFRAKHAAKESRRGEELPIQYANQRFFEENLEYW